MAKNSVKSYDSSNNRKRTINEKNKLDNLSNSKKTKKDKNVNNKDKSLENTTRIRIDNGRINDAESLDTSFLEGRLDKKSRDSIKTKEKILKERKQIFFNFEIIKCVFFGLAFVCLFVLGYVYLRDSKIFKINTDPVVNEKDAKNKVEGKRVIDKNYLFVGDLYIDKYNFDDLEYFYVKSSKEDLTTDKLLDNMKKMVYDFNPSTVFIQLGFNDLKDDKSIDDIINNYKKIIDNIKDNRPYAKIVINSLIPVNRDEDDFDSDRVKESYNDDIKELNSKLNELAKSKKIDYLDLYDLLSDDGKLNKDYTDNGIDLNDDGYDKIINKINEFLE